ncbi:MAG: iron dicitrate transport regulator FecR [Robiginitomaculum sp.]|nr:MAG: iron dicitrate transport regulator FecR [Robiginitomaculum sp.]
MKSRSEPQTLMYAEAREAPDRVCKQLKANKVLIEELAVRLRKNPPNLIVTCARGSSNNVATYAKYLIETHIGTPVLSSAPSVSSVYMAPQKIKGALFLAISQSGQSPDLLMTARAAKESGAFIVSIVNDSTSPLANMSDFVIPIHAGAEKSVAATKTFICSLSAVIHLVAVWKQNDALMAGLENMPSLLESACELDWPSGLEKLIPVHNLFVVSRGLGLGIAQEAALKLKETCGIHAEAFSAAEVKHGPMTIVQKGSPVFMYSPQDQTQESMNDVVSDFLSRGAQVLSAGHSYDQALNLDTAFCPFKELRPLLFIQSFYIFVNALSVLRGYDPDRPPYLSKVTETV